MKKFVSCLLACPFLCFAEYTPPQGIEIIRFNGGEFIETFFSGAPEKKATRSKEPVEVKAISEEEQPPEEVDETAKAIEEAEKEYRRQEREFKKMLNRMCIEEGMSLPIDMSR
jgi:hypothetical protein